MSGQRRYVSYDEIRQGIDLLCRQIVSADAWRPDVIAAVVRGGLVPAAHLCYFFERPIYFITGNLLSDHLGSHRRILVVDEINDTGRAFQRIRDQVFSQPPNHRRDVRYAVLYTRFSSNFQANYFLDFPPYFLTDAVYQHFPWEKPHSAA